LAMELLETEKAGIQILDKDNKEVFYYNKPSNTKEIYTNKTLIELYNNKNNTVFLDEVKIDNKIFTYLVFLDANKINRINYSYDVKSLKIAHNFPFIIGINIVLILAMSLLFTLKITKPINKIIDKIIDLSNEKYIADQSKKGIYSKVENCLSELTKKLILNEQERSRIEKMREEWICNITHDIKTPLTSIIGNAEILADSEYKISDEVKEHYCKTIIGKSEYIKTLIEDLNLSTRLKNNSLILNKKKVNIVSLVRHIVIDIINDEKYNYNNISFTYSKEEIFLEIDEELIKRVFVNLITNAFIHNSKDVKININIEEIENKNNLYNNKR
ncbi:MAG: sensor histidine kinase, partial [Sarcina sp.]